MKPNGHSLLAREMAATADALRHVVAGVLALVDAHDPLVDGQPDTALLLVDAFYVIDSRETLARRLAIF